VLVSRSLEDLGLAHLQLCAKHPVPEAARDAKAVLVVRKVVLEMVLLKLLVVWRQPELVSKKPLGTLDFTHFW
jgi:hypothetical protein